MKIYTSYFNNPQVKDFDGVKISIARYKPRFSLPYKIDGKIEELMPTKFLLLQYKNKEIDFEVYKDGYIDQLHDLKNRIIGKILSYDKDLVLLCYEKDKNECHRGIFSDWWFWQNPEHNRPKEL